MGKEGDSSRKSAVDRKTIEKNRRNRMKHLSFELFSLIPSHHFNPAKGGFFSQKDQIERAAGYIQMLSARVEQLKRRKAEVQSSRTNHRATGPRATPRTVIKLRDSGLDLEVVLISGVERNFMLHHIIALLDEEGAEVFAANISNVGEQIFYTLRARPKVTRVGIETSRIFGRLNELVA